MPFELIFERDLRDFLLLFNLLLWYYHSRSAAAIVAAAARRCRSGSVHCWELDIAIYWVLFNPQICTYMVCMYVCIND